MKVYGVNLTTRKIYNWILTLIFDSSYTIQRDISLTSVLTKFTEI